VSILKHLSVRPSILWRADFFYHHCAAGCKNITATDGKGVAPTVTFCFVDAALLLSAFEKLFSGSILKKVIFFMVMR